MPAKRSRPERTSGPPLPRKGDRAAPRIIVAEDDYEMRNMLAQALFQAGYLVIEIASGMDLLVYSSYLTFPDQGTWEIDLIISDIRMPGFTGLEILRGIQHLPGAPPVILITAFGDEQTHAEAERYGAAAVFDKPFNVEDLIATVREIVPVKI